MLSAASSAKSGSVDDYGIADNFINEGSHQLPPGTLFLFMLLRQSGKENVLKVM